MDSSGTRWVFLLYTLQTAISTPLVFIRHLTKTARSLGGRTFTLILQISHPSDNPSARVIFFIVLKCEGTKRMIKRHRAETSVLPWKEKIIIMNREEQKKEIRKRLL